MPSTLTCPRCDSPAPATERLCPVCGHDLRTPVMEFLDPPAGEPSVRRWIREVPPIVPLVASVGALLLAAGALAFAVLRPDPFTCGRALWHSPMAAQADPAEDGWRLEMVEPHDLGWTAFVTNGELDPGVTGAYVQVYCSAEAERLLELVRESAPDGAGEEVRRLGDETYAVRNDRQQSVQLWWRSGEVIGRVTSFSPNLDTADLESVSAFVYELVR